MTHKLFVYGTLKQGFGNHDFLENAKFLGAYDTSNANYRMVSLGNFPGVIELDGQDEHCYILGELYEVDDATLAKIDMLEGNGHFYTRKVIDLSDTDDTIEAWMYLLPQSYLDWKVFDWKVLGNNSNSKIVLNEKTNWQVWTK
jgi:gamma-glutamylcyclotransferase (GGCT)/AIG2-like uncharacterized protein YtfP